MNDFQPYIICMNPACGFNRKGSLEYLKACPKCGGQELRDTCPHCYGDGLTYEYFSDQDQLFCTRCAKRIKPLPPG